MQRPRRVVFHSRTIRSAVFFPRPLIFEMAAISELTTAVLKFVHAHSTQNGQRELRTDPADVVHQQSKQIPFSRAHESVKDMRVFAHGQMGENSDGLTGGGKFVVTRKRNENFVADAVDIDRRLSR